MAALFATLMLAACLAGAADAAGVPSLANLYLPRFRGQDWSLAGYREGAFLPNPPVRINARTQFGARGDNLTDDTAAIQAAVTAACGLPLGGAVLLPAGTYLVTSPIVINCSRVVLRGEGPASTTVYINRSLSDVFNGTWMLNPDGSITSWWTAGGAFISIQGRRKGSNDARTLLAHVPRGVNRGSPFLPVDDISQITVGLRVRVFLNDNSTNSRRRRLLAEQPSGLPRNGWGRRLLATSGIKLVSSDVPEWARAHPVFQAAVAGQAALGEDGGLTVEQAAALDRQRAQQQQGGGGGASIAAQNGTIAAWLYGNNLVDSGPDGGVINRDEMAFTAIVLAINPRTGVITLDRGIPFPVQLGWQAVVHREQPSVQDSGVEHLSIQFPWTLTQPHHGERGYNALSVGPAADCWVRNVKIVNSDAGIFFAWADRSTMTDVTLNVTANRTNPLYARTFNGHHGLSLTEGHGNLLTRFNVISPFIHDVTLASATSLNVVMEGTGTDIAFDFHRTAPWANLITRCNVGLGTRPFASGGNKNRGAYSGILNTVWNVRSASGAALPLPACSFGAYFNMIGNFSGDPCLKNGWLVRPVLPTTPPNLYLAQRNERWRRRREALARQQSRN